MRVFRVLLIAAVFAGALSGSRAFAAPLVTFNVAGTFATPDAGFPFQDIAAFTGTFTVDAGSPDTSFSAFTVFPIESSFTFLDSSNTPIFTNAFTFPDAMVRVANNFFVVFFGPGVTGTEPNDFRLQFAGPFVNTGVFPTLDTFNSAAFDFGLVETDFAGVFVDSATLAAVPEPVTTGLLATGLLGVMARRRSQRRRQR